MRQYSRRLFLAGLGAAAVSCSSASPSGSFGTRAPAPMIAADGEATRSTPTPLPPTPAPTPTLPPPPPRGTESRMLMEGTPWATRLAIRHSGAQGPAVLVLGGVHGNEPGGWMAAETILDWEPSAGSLLVVPRANALAIPAFVRTTDELGDLNRLYPGDPASPYPMERMAAAIVGVAREFAVDLLLDMHESWAFYIDAPGTGTAALGQTMTPGVGPRQAELASPIATAVNPQISQREQLLVRDGTTFARPPSATPGSGTRGRSSLSAGGHVPGLTPLLVEMGQQGQTVERRVALHLMVARAAFTAVGIM